MGMDLLARLADALGRFSQRFVPSAFAIAVLLSILTAALALVATEAGPGEVLRAWGGGFWDLLAFAMQMALVMFTGYLVATAPAVTRGLRRLAELPGSPRSATLFVALASMGLALLNWGLSIVGSAVLVRFVARRRFADGSAPDYPLLVACAYFGLGATWHAGLSASAPLTAATPGSQVTKDSAYVPIDETLLSGLNVGLVVASVALLGTLAWVLHPARERTRAVDAQAADTLGAFEPPPRTRAGFASFLDHSRVLNLAFALPALGYVALRVAEAGWRSVTLDLVNLTLLACAAVLHGSPASVLKASEEAASVLGGIVLQFPLYAGMAGIFRATKLNDVVGDFFVRHASAKTLPLIVYWYSGLVNYFVPSGGAKWAIEAPYVMKAAQTLGVAPAKMVLAYAWGDMATDLVQPFWALPLLAVARLEFKDILGYLLLACVLYVALVSVAFLAFA